MIKAVSTSTLEPPKPVSKQPANWIWIGLALVPPAFLLIVLLNHTLLVPFQDEFLFIPLVFKLHTGGFTLGDFWNQHNEHRIMVWRIIALGLARLGGYSVVKETLCGYFFALLTLLVTWRLLVRTLPQKWCGPALVACSVMIFSLGQWENWMWGFQPPWFLVNLLVLLTVLLLTYRPIRPRNFILALGLTVATTYTSGTGLLAWPAIGLAMLIYWSEWRWKYTSLWAIVAAASYGCYLIGYNFKGNGVVPPKTYALGHLSDTLIYGLNCLGLPMAYWTNSVQGCLWFSLVFLLLIALSAGWLGWQTRKDSEAKTSWEKSWPWLVMVFFAVGNVGLVAISRVGLGVESSLISSRYATITIWFWIGGAIIVGMAISQFWQLNQVKIKRPRVWLSGAGLVVLGLAISFGFTSVTGYRDWLVREDYINPFESFFYDYQTAPDYALAHLFVGHPEIARSTANLLEQYHEGPFQISKQQFQEEQNRQWHNQIQASQQPVIYPARMADLAFGELSDRKVTDEYVGFTHTGKLVVETVYDLNKFYQQAGFNKNLEKNVPVEIETQNAYFVQVYYDLGSGFRPDQVISLAVAEETANNRYFRLNLPTNTQRIQLETSYRVSRPLPDELKLTLYLEH